MKALGSRTKPYHTIPCQAKPAMPWLDETRRARTFCQVTAAPPSGFRKGIRRQFRRGMFHIFAKKFHSGTPHLLDFQVAVWLLARLYACFRKVAPLALPVEVFALVYCHHTPTLRLHPPPPPRRALGFNFEILCRQVSPHFIIEAPGSHTKPYHTMPSQASHALA